MTRPRRSVLPAGLRWRLAAWVALVVLICTGITFVAIYRGTGSELRHEIDHEIEGDAAELAHNLTITGARSPARVAQAARLYVSSQPFGASSTLLFAIVPGAGVATNRPELLSPQAKPDRGETPAEQTRENRLAANLLRAGDWLQHAAAARRCQPARAQAHAHAGRWCARDDRRGRAAGQRFARPERRRSGLRAGRDPRTDRSVVRGICDRHACVAPAAPDGRGRRPGGRRRPATPYP